MTTPRMQSCSIFAFLCLSAVAVNFAASMHIFESTLQVNEEEPIRTLANVATAGNLRAILGDIPGLSYNFMMGTDPYLEVDASTGDIRPKAKLDIEAMCRSPLNEGTTCRDDKLMHKFTIIVRSRGNQVARGTFTLTVLDVNDNAPVFAQTLHEERRDESVCVVVPIACPNRKISLSVAKDNDLSSKYNTISYSMDPINMSLNTSVDFRLISPQVGAPHLEIVSGVDAERIEQYEFTLVARDSGGKEGRTKIRIIINDVNDNSPMFTKKTYEVEVPENTLIGATIFNLTATDEDKNHDFKFALETTTPEEARRHFGVQPSGRVVVLNSLDYEFQRQFNLHLKVYEGELTDTAILKVTVTDVNDNPPQYKETAPLELDEESKSGVMVGEVQVSDRDSGEGGRFECETASQHSNSESRLKFVQNPDSGPGYYKIFAMAIIDREVDPTVTGTLTCWDLGQPRLTSTFTATVVIRDKNDNSPVFNNVGSTGVIQAELSENNEANKKFYQLSASDMDEGENSRLTYRLAAGSRHSDIFSIEPDTGFILAKVPLDRELKDSYELLVVASDNGYEPRSGSATVRVQVKDENDNPPRFTSQVGFQIEENQEPGQVLGRLTAEDPDLGPAGQVQFLQLNSRYRHLFTLDEGGTLRTNAKFDREAVSSYTIQVRAQDRGSQPLKTDREVVIRILDVNDQAPVIVSPGNNSQPTKISIYTHRVGSLVMRVRAEDGDDGLNGQIVYSLTQQQARNKFSIDASTGEIRVAQPLDLADLNRYKLMVQARDCAPTNPKSEAKVIYIDVDDSAPPVNLLDEAELAAAHTRRNVIIIIILAAVSAVLAIILIVAITCVNRPCCGVYEGGAGEAGGRGKHRGGRQRRTDGIDGIGGGGGGGDMQYTEQAQHLTVTDSEMAWAGSGVLRAPSIGSHSPIVTTSFALPQSHDASCYYGGGGGGGGACSTLPNPRHQVAGERSASRGGAQASRPGQAKSDQVNFWLYQIKEDAAASPQMQHPRYYQQQQQQHLNNFCTISRGQHQVVHYGQPQQPNNQDQPVADGAQSDSGRGCSDEDLSSGPGYHNQQGGSGTAAGAGSHHHQQVKTAYRAAAAAAAGANTVHPSSATELSANKSINAFAEYSKSAPAPAAATAPAGIKAANPAASGNCSRSQRWPQRLPCDRCLICCQSS
ncbi:hypothetical protein BOX15_Mlig014756g1 [Macrostomum lignano]|uniref:Cadherin domain-containing protein n=1 Tax=Macrostomum lignano TaxID=282301 RepID=A0A267FQK9_9PLAT|nr:hypothetical protein BOX15_Mlig014756g1 [Macrostomum lignano]